MFKIWPERDCLEALKEIDSNSIDSIVTDPPYGLKFMNKQWDYSVPSIEIWKDCLRVLKPGGHMLVACGTRTQHRMVVNIEDAGFEIRDVITWLYGSGFPKSLDISKAINKETGAEKETEGWGTALKPACEFFTLCRKPLSEKTVAKNVMKHGTGGINIDESRIALSEDDPNMRKNAANHKKNYNNPSSYGLHKTIEDEIKNCDLGRHNSQGRFPANLILDEEAGALLDEQSGKLHSGGFPKNRLSPKTKNSYGGFSMMDCPDGIGRSSGGASRFFYCAKANKKERGEGNNHPTVKPIKLMRYLCKLITPPQGIVLDPFMGSGSTGVAAIIEGFHFYGIEIEKEYSEIARARIQETQDEAPLFS